LETRVDAAPGTTDHGFEIDEDDLRPRPLRLPPRRPVLLILAILVVVALLALVPPLVSMDQYRRRIAQSISLSLGRPVRIDAVTLQLLPVPGFTLDTFVVGEDPSFGTEPVIRAQTVTVRLRASSLWRRRLEFSSISLDAPSVNLVRRSDGQWNFESILLQASRMPAAPTAQTGASQAPRFPYIEARGARVNIKDGLRKLPVALTDSKFALWLPQPEQWHVRLQGHIARTDVAVSDTGLFHVEATLGKASSLASVPVDARSEWTGAPLGGVSLLLLGRDANLRGSMDLIAALQGTLGHAALQANLAVHQLRRADFVPDQMLDLSARCTAQTRGVFAALDDVRCVSPFAGERESSLPPEVELNARLANTSKPVKAAGRVTLAGLPAAGLLTAARVVSSRISPELQASGKLGGALTFNGPGVNAAESLARPIARRQFKFTPEPVADQPEQNGFSGQFTLASARLALADTVFVDSPAITARISPAAGSGVTLTISPVPLGLGGPTPASLAFVCTGLLCQMHLSGPALRSRLLQLAAALPQFGDGLETALPPLPDAPKPDASLTPASSPEPEQPLHVDLIATRTLGGGQIWQTVPEARVPPPLHHRARHTPSRSR
jgi:hypothetical protein